MPNNKGFTLIEILIVMVIIGITIGFAMLAFGDFGEGRRILASAEQLVNTLKLGQQQAILETSTLGLRINSQNYQLLKYQNGWAPFSNKGIFKVTTFPTNTIVNLKTGFNPTSSTPSIIINASGDMTPFVLTIGSVKEPEIATITGYHNGTLQLQAGPKK